MYRWIISENRDRRSLGIRNEVFDAHRSGEVYSMKDCPERPIRTVWQEESTVSMKYRACR